MISGAARETDRAALEVLRPIGDRGLLSDLHLDPTSTLVSLGCWAVAGALLARTILDRDCRALRTERL